MNVEQKTAILNSLKVLQVFDAMTIMRLMNRLSNNLDWHECAYYLDELETRGIVRRTGRYHDRLTEYELNIPAGQ